jgi:hypothetical protein
VTSHSLALEVPLKWNIENPSRFVILRWKDGGKQKEKLPYFLSKKKILLRHGNSELEGKFRPFQAFTGYLNTQFKFVYKLLLNNLNIAVYI